MDKMASCNPEETWSGRGRLPKWVQAALARGETLAGRLRFFRKAHLEAIRAMEGGPRKRRYAKSGEGITRAAFRSRWDPVERLLVGIVVLPSPEIADGALIAQFHRPRLDGLHQLTALSRVRGLDKEIIKPALARFDELLVKKAKKRQIRRIGT